MASTGTPALTPRRLNRATLARQLLLGREPLDPVAALRRVVALQAQEPASPYLALWNRVAGFDPAAFDAALRSGTVVKATLMRITLHAVDAGDYPSFHAAMQPTLRAARLFDRRYAGAGLTIADADALVEPLRAFTAEPRTNGDIEAWLASRPDGGVDGRAWWALRAYGPFVHAPTGGPWTYGLRPAYTAAPNPAAAAPADPETALGGLVCRYLEGFGPATVQDVAAFALVQVARVRAAVAALGDALVRRSGPGGAALLDVADGPLPPEDTPAPPRLLPMWDSVMLAYADRGRIIPPSYRRHVIRANGDVLPALLVDGHVAGVWRPTTGGIEATAFHRLSAGTWAGLQSEAAALAAFVADRDPAVYRRFGRWWADLPAAEVRVLGA